MATLSQVQEVVFRLKLEDQATDAMKEAVAALKELNKEFDLNDQVVQKAGKGANALINQNDQISKTAKALTNVLRDLSDAQKALAVDAATGGEKQAALLRTVENLTTKVQAATQAHNDAVKGVKASGDAHDDAAKKVGLFGLNVQKTGFLIHDATKAIESLTLGMSPLQVAMQHVGQVQGIFGSLGEAVKQVGASFISVPGAMLAATAALVGFGVAAESESRRLGDLRQQLRATHDDYASLATATDAAAKQVAASTSLSLADARTATQTIASAKLFSGTQQDLVELAKTSQNLARVWNTDLGTASKVLAEALDNPGKVAKDLADKGFPGMTQEIAHTISIMQASAQSGQAYAQVMSIIRTGTAGATQDQSALSKALHDLGQTFTTAKDGGKSLAQSLGELTDGFAALQVRGLNNIIKLLDEYITKMQAAIKAGNVGNLATRPGGGGVDDQGRVIDPTAIGSGVTPGVGAPTTTGSLSRVDPSIQPLVDAAAKQYQIDVELLARLQRAENAAPLGKDLGGNPVFATSSTGNIGPMQVGAPTFAGMQKLPYGREFQGQALGNNTTNVNAGTSYFAFLLDKYKDKGGPYMAVLAYHDGETRIDDMLAGNRDSHGFSIQASTAAYQEADKVTGGYTGPGLTAPYRYSRSGSAPTAAGGYDYISPAGGNLSAVIRANDLATSQNAFNLATGINPLSAQIEKANADIKGLQAGLDLATKAGDTEEIKRLSDALAKAKGDATNLITEQQKLARASQDAVAPLAAEEGATRTLAVVQQQFVQAARAAGTDIDQGALQAALANKLRELATAFDDTVKAADRQTAANQRIAASVDTTAPSLIAATNREKALAQAREDYLPGPEQDAAVDRYTAALNRQSASAADLATVQKSFDQRDQLQVLQLETDTLGKNTDQRDKEIALLKEKQALIKSGADVQSAASKADLANVAAIQDATAALNLQKSSLAELSNFFTSTFDTIGNAIVSAFATGEQSAVKFKDVAASVEKAVEAEFLKLALLNPLKNFLFGEKNPTLSSGIGVLGKLFGGSGSSSGSSGFDTELSAFAAVASTVQAGSAASSLFDAPGIALGSSSGSGASTASSGGGILGGLKSLFGLAQTGDSLGLTGSGGGIIASLGGKIVTGITNLLGSGITNAATQIATQVAVSSATESGLVTAGALPRLAAGVSLSLGATNETATAVATAASKVSDALPYVGAAISVITNLISGNIRGAALTGGGALVGAGIGFLAGGPPGAAVGVAIGSIVGGLVDAILPNHPLHPFDATALNAQGGQLAVGKTATQAEGANSLGEVQQFVTGINTFMAKAGIILANADGQLGAVGQGIAGMVGLVTSPDQLIKTLNFRNNPDDTSQFGVAKGALSGMTFQDAQSLQDEILKIAAFADATEAIGVRLRSVGTDLTNINVASVEGVNPSATGATTGANGESVQYLNDLRTALNNDLPSKTYANVQALDDEINSVNQFVNSTLPGLLHPIQQTSSSIVDEANKTIQSYEQAISQSLQYGLDNTAVLKNAEEEALTIVRRSGVEQIHATATQLADRLSVAQGGGQDALSKQALDNFDIQAQQQRDALQKLWTDTYGDITLSSKDYLASMNQLEQTLGAERVSLVQQQQDQMGAAARQTQAVYQSLADSVSGYAVRIENATGQGQLAQLTEFDAKAAQERVGFIKSFTDAFGDAILANETFQAQLATVDATHYAERLALLQSFHTQADQKFASLQDLVGGIQARGYAAAGDQKDADLINFDIKARQELASFQQSFVDLYGPAITANENYQAQLTGLETVQGQERLQILQKYGDAVTGATADQLKAAQSSVTSLFTSLGDYVTKLQSGTDSPLSPTAQYDFAKGQFNAVAGAAAAGDATSAGKLTGFGDTFLSASRAIYGSGVGYATDFNRVLDAIQSVVQAPVDALTNSFLALQLQQQTTSITQAQQATTDAINALRREVMQQSRLLATAA